MKVSSLVSIGTSLFVGSAMVVALAACAGSHDSAPAAGTLGGPVQGHGSQTDPASRAAVSCGLADQVCLEIPGATSQENTALIGACSSANATVRMEACSGANVASTCEFRKNGIAFSMRFYGVTMGQARQVCDRENGQLKAGR